MLLKDCKVGNLLVETISPFETANHPLIICDNSDRVPLIYFSGYNVTTNWYSEINVRTVLL